MSIDDIHDSANFDSSLAGQYAQWFQSPDFENGPHTITIRDLDDAEVDYALVSTDDPPSYADVVVDDLNSSISYNGDWTTETILQSPSSVLPINPFGNSTHTTRTASDTSFRVPFVGAFRCYSISSGRA